MEKTVHFGNTLQLVKVDWRETDPGNLFGGHGIGLWHHVSDFLELKIFPKWEIFPFKSNWAEIGISRNQKWYLLSETKAYWAAQGGAEFFSSFNQI